MLYSTRGFLVAQFSPCLELKKLFLHLAAEVDLLRGRGSKVLIQDAEKARELLVRVDQFLDRGWT